VSNARGARAQLQEPGAKEGVALFARGGQGAGANSAIGKDFAGAFQIRLERGGKTQEVGRAGGDLTVTVWGRAGLVATAGGGTFLRGTTGAARATTATEVGDTGHVVGTNTTGWSDHWNVGLGDL